MLMYLVRTNVANAKGELCLPVRESLPALWAETRSLSQLAKANFPPAAQRRNEDARASLRQAIDVSGNRTEYSDLVQELRRRWL